MFSFPRLLTRSGRRAGAVLVVALGVPVGCAKIAGYDDYGFDRQRVASPTGGTGGENPTEGGTSSGGASSGGASSGGTNSGGTNSGGASSGGASSGGTNSGGTNSGGTNSGGTSSGGTNSGGTSSGGTSSGGTSSGGASSGGENSGGASSGGENSGGTSSGGENSGGASSGGAGNGDDASAGSGGAGTGGSSGSGAGGETGQGGADAGTPDGPQPVWAPDTVPTSCPPSSFGPEMVPIRGGYCIDKTEVTRSQYAAWLATWPDPSSQGTDCSWNATFEPNQVCLTANMTCQTDCADHPQICVDVCDARSYCKASGKRLCGAIGASANAHADSTDPTKSQWFNACSSGGVHAFPYGDVFVNGMCNMSLNLWDYDVGAFKDCQSKEDGYSGVMDLAGNVWEWEDSCEVVKGQLQCLIRGGFFSSWDDNSRCDFAPAGSYAGQNNVGFRCCSP